jgi:hypothetical protein
MDARFTHQPPGRPLPDTFDRGQHRRDLTLLVGAVGVCAVVGVLAAWSLFFGLPGGDWTTVALIASLAIIACAGVATARRSRGHRTKFSPLYPTPPGVGYSGEQDLPSEST